jgi:hypothetical protein
MKLASGLVVLEGRWQKAKNLSVKSLFDVLIDMNFDNPHEYYYEKFANYSSLKAILSDMGRYSGGKYLYIGGHGDENVLWGSIDFISRTQFRNALKGELGGGYQGIFLGSCLFGSSRNANYLFDILPNNIKWIAGYSKSIDWVDSSVLDLLFWNTFFSYDSAKCTNREIIELTCEEIFETSVGLIEKLGFHVFARRQGRTPGVINLLESENEPEDD